jgi:hypothetical protein
MSLILPKGMQAINAMQYGTSSGNPLSNRPNIKVYCRSRGEYCELAEIREHSILSQALICTHPQGPTGPLVVIKPNESDLDVCMGKMCPIQKQLTKEAYRELLAHEPNYNW